jgi:hypothetical protein
MCNEVDSMGEGVKSLGHDALCLHRDSNTVHHDYNSNTLGLSQIVRWLNFQIFSL